MKFILAFIAILFLPISIMPANARVVVKEITKYYNVTGHTGKQVYARLGRRGPWHLRRTNAMATTVREFDFKNIKFKVRGNKCVVDNLEVHMKITFTYPRWVTQKRGSKKAQQAWRRLSNELVRHEETHGKYFKQTGKIIDKELRRVTENVSNNCRGMDKKVQAIIDKNVDQGWAKHLAFDRSEYLDSSKLPKLERAFIKVK